MLEAVDRTERTKLTDGDLQKEDGYADNEEHYKERYEERGTAVFEDQERKAPHVSQSNSITDYGQYEF